MSKKIGSAISILFCFLLLQACGGKEEATEPASMGQIEGTVFNSVSGINIGGAVVTTDAPTSAVTTDTLGTYQIRNVLPGAYSVWATKVGYSRQNVQVTVVAGHSTIADMALTANLDSLLRLAPSN